MIEITSRKNKAVLDALELHDKRGRDAAGLFFTEGSKLLGEALNVGLIPKRVFVTEEYIASHPDVKQLDTEVIKVTGEVYEKITDEKAPEGVFAIFEKKKISAEDKKSSVLLLENIQDPGNMGTLIRCAVAFGVREVISVSSADIYSPKAVRSTMGAVFKMPISVFDCIDRAVEYARGFGGAVIATALAPDSVAIDGVDTSSAVIMIGNEGKGLSARALELADIKMIIPIENIESLNASAAGAICMYDSMVKRRRLSE